MGIVEELTPATYRLRSLHIEQDDAGEVVVIGDLEIRNADGRPIAQDAPSVTLTETERQQLAAFLADKLAAYEAATGLARYTGETTP